MTFDLCAPIILVDLAGGVCLIIVSALCLRESRNIVKKEPGNFLFSYMHWLFMALFAFSLSRSLGHIVKHVLWALGLEDLWASLSPVSGSVNSALFILIASITVFFQKMKNVMERIERDRAEIERISQELLRLNEETELLVSERTRAELALSIAHNIRNPIMVIGGLAKRFLKKGHLTEDQRKKIELMLEQIEKLDEIVREFELIKGKKAASISKRDLNSLVKTVLEAAGPEAQDRGIDIAARYESRPLYVNMDPDLIKFALVQCLRLLIYRLRAGSRLKLILKRGKFGAVVIFITSPFEKGASYVGHSSSTKTASTLRGKRLGLSTVRQILRDHGGDLHVEGHGEALKIEIFLPFNIGTAKTWSRDRKEVELPSIKQNTDNNGK